MRLGVRPRAILSILGAVLFLTASDSLIKWLSGDFPLHQVMFTRSLVALVLISSFIWFEGGFTILRVKRPGLHILRGLMIVTANMCFFLGVASLHLAEAMALFFVAPLVITIMAVPILGEKVGLYRWCAVGVGLIGVLIMLRPGFGVFQPAALLPLLAAFFYSCMQMLTRKLGITDKAGALSFYVLITFITVSALFGLAIGDGRFSGGGNPSLEFLTRAWVLPSPHTWVLLVAIGLLNGTGGYLMGQAYRLGEATVVAPFEYFAMPLAVFWGFQLWGELPDGWELVGILFIIGAGLLVIARERIKGRAVAAKAPMPPG